MTSALDDLLPSYDEREFHACWVDAAPGEALAAARTATVAEMPGVVLMLAARALPARLLGRRPAERPAGSIFELLQGEGYALLVDQDDEVVLGGIDRPWRVFGSATARVSTPEEFQAFDRPGWARVATNLRVETREGRTRLTTETRILATSSDARWKFRAYWFVIMPGSALIRRLWLRAARRRAEAATQADPR